MFLVNNNLRYFFLPLDYEHVFLDEVITTIFIRRIYEDVVIVDPSVPDDLPSSLKVANFIVANSMVAFQPGTVDSIMLTQLKADFEIFFW